MPSTSELKRSKAAREKIEAIDEYAPQAWGKGKVEEIIEDVVCPSGQKCLARRPGLQGLLGAGIVDKMDTITGTINKKHIKRVKGGRPVELEAEEVMKDPDALVGILDTADKVALYIVVRPALTASPECTALGKGVCKASYNEHIIKESVTHTFDFDADPDAVYVHNVELEDKMYLMNFAVGGTRDLDSFREQSAEMLGNLSDGQDVQLPAVGTPGDQG
jgi:hypothetical protein